MKWPQVTSRYKQPIDCIVMLTCHALLLCNPMTPSNWEPWIWNAAETENTQNTTGGPAGLCEMHQNTTGVTLKLDSFGQLMRTNVPLGKNLSDKPVKQVFCFVLLSRSNIDSHWDLSRLSEETITLLCLHQTSAPWACNHSHAHSLSQIWLQRLIDFHVWVPVDVQCAPSPPPGQKHLLCQVKYENVPWQMRDSCKIGKN